MHSIATSNELLAQQLPKILPVQYAAAPRNAIRLQQAHDGGTMVEAAVLKVLERDDGQEAVAELAVADERRATTRPSSTPRGVY